MLFEKLNSAPFQDHEKTINNLINVNDRVVLDIGCGAGALVKHLNSRVGATLPSVGVDLSHNALRLADSVSYTHLRAHET